MKCYIVLFGTVLCQSVYCGCCGNGGSKNSSKSKNSKKSSNQKPGTQGSDDGRLGPGGAKPIKTTNPADGGIVDPNGVRGLERLPYYEKAMNWTNLCTPGNELADCIDVFTKYHDLIMKIMCFIKDGADIDPSNNTGRETENTAKFRKACDTVRTLTQDAFWKSDRTEPGMLSGFFSDFDIENEHILFIYRDEKTFYLWYGETKDFNNNDSKIGVDIKKSVTTYGAYILENGTTLMRIGTDLYIHDQNGKQVEKLF